MMPATEATPSDKGFTSHPQSRSVKRHTRQGERQGQVLGDDVACDVGRRMKIIPERHVLDDDGRPVPGNPSRLEDRRLKKRWQISRPSPTDTVANNRGAGQAYENSDEYR
jgi:hypothetical protein